MSTTELTNGQGSGQTELNRVSLLEAIESRIDQAIAPHKNLPFIAGVIDPLREKIRTFMKKAPAGSVVGEELSHILQDHMPEFGFDDENLFEIYGNIANGIADILDDTTGKIRRLGKKGGALILKETTPEFPPGTTITKDELFEILQNVVKLEDTFPKVNTTNNAALPAYQAARAKFQKEAGDRFDALPDVIDNHQFAKFHDDNQRAFDTIIKPTLAACGRASADANYNLFMLQHARCARDVMQHFAKQVKGVEAKEKKEVKISRVVFCDMSNFYGKEISNAPETAEEFERGRRIPGMQDALTRVRQSIDKTYVEKINNLPTHLTEEECLAFLAKDTEALIEAHNPILKLDQSFGMFLISDIRLQAKMVEKETKEWFSKRKSRPETEPGEVLMPYDTFAEYWNELDRAFASVHAEVQKANSDLTSKQSRKIGREHKENKIFAAKWRRRIMESAMTELECLQFIHEIESDIEKSFMGNDRQVVAFRKLMTDTHKRGCAAWKKKVVNWFARHKKKPERIEVAPVRMTLTRYRAITNHATSIRDTLDPHAGKIEEALARMSAEAKDEIAAAMERAEKLQKELLSSEFTKEDFLRCWPQLKSNGETLERTLSKINPDVFGEMFKSTTAINAEIERQILEWFDREEKENAEMGPATISRDQIDQILQEQKRPTLELVTVGGKSQDAEQVITDLIQANNAIFFELPPFLTEEHLKTYQQEKRINLLRHLARMQLILQDASYKELKLSMMQFYDWTDAEMLRCFEKINSNSKEEAPLMISNEEMRKMFIGRKMPELSLKIFNGKEQQFMTFFEKMEAENERLSTNLPDLLDRGRVEQYQQERRQNISNYFAKVEPLLEKQSYDDTQRTFVQFYDKMDQEVLAWFDAKMTGAVEIDATRIPHSELNQLLHNVEKEIGDTFLAAYPAGSYALTQRGGDALTGFKTENVRQFSALPASVSQQEFQQFYDDQYFRLLQCLVLIKSDMKPESVFDAYKEHLVAISRKKQEVVNQWFATHTATAGHTPTEYRTTTSFTELEEMNNRIKKEIGLDVTDAQINGKVKTLLQSLGTENVKICKKLPANITEEDFIRLSDEIQENTVIHMDKIRLVAPADIYEKLNKHFLELNRRTAIEGMEWFNDHRPPASVEKDYKGMIPKSIMQKIWMDAKSHFANDESAKKMVAKMLPLVTPTIQKTGKEYDKKIDEIFDAVPPLISWSDFQKYVNDVRPYQIKAFEIYKEKHPVLWAEMEAQTNREFAAIIEKIREWFEEHATGIESLKKGDRGYFTISSPDGQIATWMTRIDLDVITQQIRSIYKVAIRIPSGNPHIEAMVKEHNTLERGLFSDLPEKIDDYRILTEYHRSLVTLFSDLFRKISVAGHPEICAAPRTVMLTGQLEIEKAIRSSCALPHTPVSSDGRATMMADWELSAIHAIAFKDDQIPTFKITREAGEKLKQEKARTDRYAKEHFQCPPYFDQYRAIQDYIAITEEAHNQLFVVIKRLCSAEDAEAYNRDFQKGKQLFIEEIHKNYLLKGAPDLSPKPTSISLTEFDELYQRVQSKDKFILPSGVPAVMRAASQFATDNKVLWQTLPVVIDDYQSIIDFHAESISLFNKFESSLCTLIPEGELKEGRARFLKNTLGVERALRSEYNLKNAQVVQDGTGRSLVLPSWEFSQIINANYAEHKTSFPASSDAEERYILDIIDRYQRELNEKLNGMPPEIRDVATFERFMDIIAALQQNLITTLQVRCSTQVIKTLTINSANVYAGIHAEIRKYYLLSGMSLESMSKPTTLSRDQLHEIAADVWIDRSVIEQKIGELFKTKIGNAVIAAPVQAYMKSMQEMLVLLCPATVASISDLDPFFSQIDNQGSIALQNAQSLGATNTMQFQTEICQELSAWVKRTLDLKGGIDRPLPNILTKEWIAEEIAHASTLSDAAVNHRGGDTHFASVAEKILNSACDIERGRPEGLAPIICWLTGKTEAIDVLVIPGRTPLHHEQRDLNRANFNMALERIMTVFQKNVATTLPSGPYLPGIKTWPMERMETGILTQTVGEEILNEVKDAFDGFVRKNRAQLPAQYMTDWRVIFGNYSDAFRHFLETFCPPTLEFATLQGMTGFLDELSWAVVDHMEAYGIDAKNPLRTLLGGRINNKYSQVCLSYVEIMNKKTAEKLKEQKKHSGPPAIIRGPLPVKESKTAGGERFWNEVISRSLASLTPQFVEQCEKAGIAFPSVNKARSARIILGQVFRSLETHCATAIARLFKEGGIAPSATELNATLIDAVMSFTIPANCPAEFATAFEATIREGLFEVIADNRLLDADLSRVHNPRTTWDTALEPLFKAKESLPSSERAEMHTMLQPIKHVFAAGMIRNMIQSVDRRVSVQDGEKTSFAVSAKGFSRQWIPIIEKAVSVIVDQYADEQPSRSATIAEFLDKHFSSVRQRSLFPRIGSAAQSKLRALGSGAPAESMLASMRMPIAVIDMNQLHDTDTASLETFVRHELLGTRDTTLLPEERSTLEQFCSNILDLDGDIPAQLAALGPALIQLANACNTNFHAAFPCRTPDHFADAITEIVATLQAAHLRKVAPTVSAEDALLPPEVLALSKACEENTKWIATWPRGKKKDNALPGFMQQVLHWHEIAVTYVQRCRTTGKMNGHFEEASLCAESVTMVRSKNILKVQEAASTSTGRVRKAGLVVVERKVRSFYDWRHARAQSLHTGHSTGEANGVLHESARTGMSVLWQISAEMQLLATQLLSETDHSAEIHSLKVRLTHHQASIESMSAEHTEMSDLLGSMTEWFETAAERGQQLLSSIRYSLSASQTECTAAEAGMARLQILVNDSQRKLSEYTRGKGSDAAVLKSLCHIVTVVQNELEELEEKTITVFYKTRDQLTVLEKELQSCMTDIGDAHASNAEPHNADGDFDQLCKDATAFIAQAKEWKFYRDEHGNSEQQINVLRAQMQADQEKHDRLGSEHAGTSEARKRYQQLEKILEQTNAALRSYFPPK